MMHLLRRLEWTVRFGKWEYCPICYRSKEVGNTIECELWEALNGHDDRAQLMMEIKGLRRELAQHEARIAMEGGREKYCK